MRPPSPIKPPARYQKFELYPFQQQAIAAIEAGRSAIVSAPTGAGKTLIAEFAIERALLRNWRIIYTAPIKALSNQKYRDFQSRYGNQVGIMTGDVTINGTAPVLIMTTEIFRNTIFTDPERLQGISEVILDEIHYISDRDRGTVWEESIIFAPQSIRFLGLSATISNLDEFRDWMASVRQGPVDLVSTLDRPVPLKHWICIPEIGVVRISDFKRLLPRALSLRRQTGIQKKRFNIFRHLQKESLLPALFFCFSRREVERRARSAQGLRLLDKGETERILKLFDHLLEQFQVKDTGRVGNLRSLAGRGILFHHAGMLPVFKEIVERLFTTGLVKLLFATETFALGVNMPARTVAFSSLRKFNGVGFDYLATLDYYQMAGRAGRQGIDKEGTVCSMVNVEFDSPKNVKQVIFGKVAPLSSRFNLSYSAVLNLLGLLGDDIGSAVTRSFSTFQQGGNPRRDLNRLEARMKVLEHMGYITGRRLLGKGRIAARLNGYEVQVTELYWSGIFEALSPEECAVLMVSVVFEPRKGEYERMTLKSLGNLRNRALKTINRFRKQEQKAGIKESVKTPDFGLSPAVQAWVRGTPLEELHHFTSSQEGDIVRNLRMGIQLLRQFAQAVPEDRELADRLWTARSLVNRNEVDAERQIRLATNSPVF